MAVTAEYREKGADYPPMPDDLYLCQLTKVEMVKQKKFQSEEMEDKIRFEFTSLEHSRDDNSPVIFWHRVRPIYGPDNANLTKLMDKMLGRRYTKEEWARINAAGGLDKLVGKRYNVLVVQAGEYNNVISALPAPADAKATPKATAPPASTAKESITDQSHVRGVNQQLDKDAVLEPIAGDPFAEVDPFETAA